MFDRPLHCFLAGPDLSPVGYPSATAWRRLAELQQRLSAVPGVERVSLSENGLFYGGDSQSHVSLAGMTPPPQQDANVRIYWAFCWAAA